MTHWGWYWKVQKKHMPKTSCSALWLCEIDSFEMFKHQKLIQIVRDSESRVVLQIPRYNLKAILMENDSLSVVYDGGSYIILVEKKSCNYGGFYYFFHCPTCNIRMRKLYCVEGKYLCRKCAKLGYYSQRLRPSRRSMYMKIKIQEKLENRAGSLEQKPPRMQEHIFQKLRRQYVKYDESHIKELNKELLYWFGVKGDCYFPPSGMLDAYVEKEEIK